VRERLLPQARNAIGCRSVPMSGGAECAKFSTNPAVFPWLPAQMNDRAG